MTNICIHFGECEHEGDLNRYMEDLTQSGAHVILHELNYEAETAEVHVEIKDKKDFLTRFKQTDSIEFSGSLQYEQWDKGGK